MPPVLPDVLVSRTLLGRTPPNGTFAEPDPTEQDFSRGAGVSGPIPHGPVHGQRPFTEELTRRGPARRLLVQAAWILGARDVTRIGELTGISRSRVYALTSDLPARDGTIADPGLAAVVRCAGDPRFVVLPEVGSTGGWKRYSGRK